LEDGVRVTAICTGRHRHRDDRRAARRHAQGRPGCAPRRWRRWSPSCWRFPTRRACPSSSPTPGWRA